MEVNLQDWGTVGTRDLNSAEKERAISILKRKEANSEHGAKNKRRGFCAPGSSPLERKKETK